jgi:hypothetical protein
VKQLKDCTSAGFGSFDTGWVEHFLCLCWLAHEFQLATRLGLFSQVEPAVAIVSTLRDRRCLNQVASASYLGVPPSWVSILGSIRMNNKKNSAQTRSFLLLVGGTVEPTG